MAVFRVERTTGYTVMSNHHLRNKELISMAAASMISFITHLESATMRSDALASPFTMNM